MNLAEILQSKIATKQEGDRQSRHRMYEKTEDVVKMLRQATTTSTTAPFQPISLDMFIAFREEFHSGWNLWLGDDEVATLPPNLKELFSPMTFDEKALKSFRLTLWTTNKKRALDYEDITDIPDGAEVFVERVTGLSLFDDKMAQGNASKIEIVTRVGDGAAEINASDRKVVCSGVKVQMEVKLTTTFTPRRSKREIRGRRKPRRNRHDDVLSRLQIAKSIGIGIRLGQSDAN